MSDTKIRLCEVCGKSEDEVGQIDTHSGVLECWPCWNWRKLNGPASTAWSKLTKEFFSTVDMHDLTNFFPKSCDLSSDEVKELFRLVRKIEIGADHGLALAYQRVAERA